MRINARVDIIGEITLDANEIKQLYRLCRNECEGAQIVEGTTSAMYEKLKKFFKEVEYYDKHRNDE